MSEQRSELLGQIADAVSEAVSAAEFVLNHLVFYRRVPPSNIAWDEMAYIKARRAGRAGNRALNLLAALAPSSLPESGPQVTEQECS